MGRKFTFDFKNISENCLGEKKYFKCPLACFKKERFFCTRERNKREDGRLDESEKSHMSKTGPQVPGLIFGSRGAPCPSSSSFPLWPQDQGQEPGARDDWTL